MCLVQSVFWYSCCAPWNFSRQVKTPRVWLCDKAYKPQSRICFGGCATSPEGRLVFGLNTFDALRRSQLLTVRYAFHKTSMGHAQRLCKIRPKSKTSIHFLHPRPPRWLTYCDWRSRLKNPHLEYKTHLESLFRAFRETSEGPMHPPYAYRPRADCALGSFRQMASKRQR